MVLETHIAEDEAVGVTNLTKSFDGNNIFRNISFSLKRGSVLSIIGPSGSGKSTLLRCLNLLEKFEAGQVRFNGNTIAEYNNNKNEFLSVEYPEKIRMKIGMVFQEWNLWPNKTVEENIIEAPILVLNKSKKEAIEKARMLCEKVHLLHKLKSYPNELSGGEKQRAAIARALAMEPEILMLDEITSALDPYLIAEILEVITSIKGELKTLIIVTHHMSFAKAISDEVIFLCNGEILESGLTEKVLNSPQTPELQKFLVTLEKIH